jgi:hypothetical protein
MLAKPLRSVPGTDSPKDVGAAIPPVKSLDFLRDLPVVTLVLGGSDVFYLAGSRHVVNHNSYESAESGLTV